MYYTLAIIRNKNSKHPGPMELVANHEFGQTTLAHFYSSTVLVTKRLDDNLKYDKQVEVKSFEEGLPIIEATLAQINAYYAASAAKQAAAKDLFNRFVSHFGLPA